MRKILMTLLLASAAVASPALADPNDADTPRVTGDRSEHHPSFGQMRSERGAERHNDSRPSDGPRVRSFDGGGNGGGGSDASTSDTRHDSADSVRNWRRGGGGQEMGGGAAVVDQPQADRHENGGGWQHRVVESSAGDQAAGQGGEDRRGFWQRRTRVPMAGSGDQIGSGGLVQPERPLPRVMRSRTPVISDIPRQGTQPPLRTDLRRSSHVEWNHNWRHDRRYDWVNWRRSHRSHFHLGIYYDPFGWGYQPYSIGWRLWPSYYSSRFWINDPWEYRLPYAPPGTRWVRYFNDAVLVDTWTGEVVDVIYDFFW